MMSERLRLPNRRPALTEMIEIHGTAYAIGVHMDPAGRAREVFLRGAKTGGHMEGIMDDACVLISLVLQTGIAAQDLPRRLGGCADDLSPIALVAARIAEIEARDGDLWRDTWSGANAARVAP